MRLRTYFIISIVAIVLIATPLPYMVLAQDKGMETDEGMVIEETRVKTIKDADGTSPGGILEAPKPEGSVGGTSDGSGATATEEETEPDESKIKMDESKIEAIIPSYTFGMKRLMKSAEKSLERVKKEITKRNKAGKKAKAEEVKDEKPPVTEKDGEGKKDTMPGTVEKKRSSSYSTSRLNPVKPERRKCEVSSKKRTVETRVSGHKFGPKNPGCTGNKISGPAICKKAICKSDEQATPKPQAAHAKEVSKNAEENNRDEERLLEKIARQEADMKSEQERFARERAKYVGPGPGAGEKLPDQAKQEEDMKAEQERFARERARYATKTPGIGSEQIIKTWEKYGVATKEEIAREREYLEEEKSKIK